MRKNQGFVNGLWQLLNINLVSSLIIMYKMYTQMGAYMETHHHGNALKKGTHKTNLI